MKQRTYEDMLDLPHHVSLTRPRMSLRDRAAQFSPFAALTGHDAAIQETARLTDQNSELDENHLTLLNDRLQTILRWLPEAPEVTVTWFRPDDRKDGGAYLQSTGSVKKLDPYEHTLILADGSAIPVEQIYMIEGAIFQNDDLF